MNAEKKQLIDTLNTLGGVIIQEFVLVNPLKLTTQELHWAANYLHFRSKIKKKVPAWSDTTYLEPPPAISIEQSSSQQTAEFKAALISGKSCFDLTGGMGIDTYFFSKKFQEVVYVEQRSELVETAQRNFEALGVKNVKIMHGDAEDVLERTHQPIDLIYLDPARRDKHGSKVFFIPDCSPNVSDLLPKLLPKTDNVLIKYAPMLDIKAAIAALKTVYKVFVIAVDNDVKEVLYWIRKPITTEEPPIEAVNLSKENQPAVCSTFGNELATQVSFTTPRTYLYEPNAAVLKAGMFKSVARLHNLSKIASNTHLYTSDDLKDNFPGRSFRVTKVEKFNKKQLKKALNGQYVNISCRNFPLKPDVLKQLFNFKDGGEAYLFFTQNQLNEKIVIFTHKISNEETL